MRHHHHHVDAPGHDHGGTAIHDNDTPNVGINDVAAVQQWSAAGYSPLDELRANYVDACARYDSAIEHGLFGSVAKATDARRTATDILVAALDAASNEVTP